MGAMQSLKTNEIISLTDPQQDRLEERLMKSGEVYEALALPFEELWGERAAQFPQSHGKVVPVLRIPHRLFISERNLVKREREKANLDSRRGRQRRAR